MNDRGYSTCFEYWFICHQISLSTKISWRSVVFAMYCTFLLDQSQYTLKLRKQTHRHIWWDLLGSFHNEHLSKCQTLNKIRDEFNSFVYFSKIARFFSLKAFFQQIFDSTTFIVKNSCKTNIQSISNEWMIIPQKNLCKFMKRTVGHCEYSPLLHPEVMFYKMPESLNLIAFFYVALSVQKRVDNCINTRSTSAVGR